MAMSSRSLSLPRMTCESSGLQGCQLFARRLRILTSPSPCTVAPLSSKHTRRNLGCVVSLEQMYHSRDVWICVYQGMFGSEMFVGDLKWNFVGKRETEWM